MIIEGSTVLLVVKAVKIRSLAAKSSGIHVCSAKAKPMTKHRCVNSYHSRLNNRPIHQLSKAGADKIHQIGHDLFTGNTPLGERLENTDGTIQYRLGPDGITASELWIAPSNAENISITGQYFGWATTRKQVIESDHAF